MKLSLTARIIASIKGFTIVAALIALFALMGFGKINNSYVYDQSKIKNVKRLKAA